MFFRSLALLLAIFGIRIGRQEAVTRKCTRTSMCTRDGKQILLNEFWIGVTRNFVTT